MKRKIQLIETIDSTGPYFKVTDGTDSKYVCYKTDGTSRSRDEALATAKEIFQFWYENNSTNKIIMEFELTEV